MLSEPGMCTALRRKSTMAWKRARHFRRWAARGFWACRELTWVTARALSEWQRISLPAQYLPQTPAAATIGNNSLRAIEERGVSLSQGNWNQNGGAQAPPQPQDPDASQNSS